MSAYIIVQREGPLQDPEAFAEYQRLTRLIKGDYKLKPRAVYGAIEALEGAAPTAVVMLEFPTMEEASAWYNSPGYQAALPHRLQSAQYRSFIVEGV